MDEKVNGEIINIGSENEKSIKEVAAVIKINEFFFKNCSSSFRRGISTWL